MTEQAERALSHPLQREHPAASHGESSKLAALRYWGDSSLHTCSMLPSSGVDFAACAHAARGTVMAGGDARVVGRVEGEEECEGGGRGADFGGADSGQL